MATKRVLVPIANGSEEIEAVCIIDTLRRAGATVVVASANPGTMEVVCSRKVVITADASIDECLGQEWDLIALPGGMPGAENLKNSAPLKQLLLAQAKDKSKFFAAICASPGVVLAAHGLLDHIEATAFPAHQAKLPKANASKRVVVSGNCITSQGPGTSLEFALTLVELLFGKDESAKLESSMLVQGFHHLH